MKKNKLKRIKLPSSDQLYLMAIARAELILENIRGKNERSIK